MRMRMISVVAVCLSFVFSAWAFDSRDADAAFNAYNSHFYANGNGPAHYKENTSGGHSGFWEQAEQIEMIEDAFDRTHDAATRLMIVQSIAGFVEAHGTLWTRNSYNDDITWMAIACARGYLATGYSAYSDLAKRNFDAMYARGWDSALGGGLWWSMGKTNKNACINGPAAIAACLLFQISGDKLYLNKAQAIYGWERTVLFNPANGAVHDHVRDHGHIGEKTFTYNEGTFIGAADLLWKLTGDTNYLNDALLAAKFTRDVLSAGNNLPVYGNGDAAGFNGIFIRWMARYLNDAHLWPQFYPWMSANANAAWRVRREDNLSWQNWNEPTPEGKLNSWNCSDTVVALQVVPAEAPK